MGQPEACGRWPLQGLWALGSRRRMARSCRPMQIRSGATAVGVVPIRQPVGQRHLGAPGADCGLHGTALRCPGETGIPGTVTFYDNGTTIGTVQPTSVSGSQSVATHSSLPAGPQHITAVLSNSLGSFTSATVTVTAGPPARNVGHRRATKTTIRTTANPARSGYPVTLTATVAREAPGSGTPRGIVTFLNDGHILGTERLAT